MELNLSYYNILKGAYAVVLIDKISKTAFKLFKSYDHPDLDGTSKEEIGEDKTNDYHRKVYKTEIEAYELVEKSSLLKAHTPKFYGTYKIDKVMDDGQNVTHQYLTDCCYQMEFICGEENKVNSILCNRDLLKKLEDNIGFKLKHILDEFQQVGIKYTTDSSAVFNDTEFKIIDFGIVDSGEFQPIIEM